MKSRKKVKLDMLQITAIVLLSAVVCTSSAPSTCSAAVDYFSTVIDTTLLWQSPSIAPDGVCSLPSTCCSSSAIAALKAIASTRHRSQVSTLTAAAKGSCFGEQAENTIASFLMAEKASMREKARLFLNEHYTDELGLIFDRFVDSAGDFMRGTRPVCGLEDLLPELAFSVFWPFAKQVYPELSTASTAYQECAKEFVNDHYEININEARRSFEQPLLRIAHLFTYRNAILSAVADLEREELSPICLADLVETQYCDGCSGEHSEALAYCTSQCRFAAGTCLKPYEALSDIINDWTLYARELSEAITTFNPDYMFSSVPWKILDIAADLTIPGSTVKSQMDDRCAGTDRRRRTTQGLGLVRRPNHSVIRRKRQTVASPHSVAQTEIDCLTTLVSSLSHEAIAGALCVNATSAAPCDAGATVSRNLPIELSDPLRNTVQDLNWQRKYILAVLFRCEEAHHGVCPDVWNYCWEPPLPPTPTETTASILSSTSSAVASSNPPPTSSSLSTSSPSTTSSPTTTSSSLPTSSLPTSSSSLPTSSLPTSSSSLPTSSPTTTSSSLPTSSPTTTSSSLPTSSPLPSPPPCSNTGEEFPDQGTGDRELRPGGCLPASSATPSPSVQPTVPTVAERTGGGAAIRDGCSCVTVTLLLLTSVLTWAY